MEGEQENSGNTGGEISGDGDKVSQRTFTEGGNTQGGGNGGSEKYVPYERFNEVNGKYRDLETKYSEVQKALDEMRNPKPNQDKEFSEKFYKDPVATMREFVKENIESLKAEGTEREKAAARGRAIEWFQKQEDYTPELEEKAAQFIKENGLQGIDPDKAIRLAHKFVTMGDGSGYTRQVKEGLRKPGVGGKGKEADYRAELAAIDPTDPDYEKKMTELHSKITGR